MTYNEFKRLADRAIAESRVKAGTIYNGKIALDQDDANALTAITSVSICVCTIAKDYCFRFYELLNATRNADKRSRYGLKETFATDGKVRAMNNRLLSLIKDFDHQLNDFGNGRTDEVLMMCDAIDRAEEMLDPILQAYRRLIMKRITTKTLSTCLDPVLFGQLIMAFVMLSICNSVYGTIIYEKNFPIVKQFHDFDFLKMNRLFDQMQKLLLVLDFHDTNMSELKTNINALVREKEAQQMADDIIYMIFSLDFHRELLLASNQGIDVKPAPHESMFASLDKYTLTIDEYAAKYNNLYLAV